MKEVEKKKKKDVFGKEKIPGTFKWWVIRLMGLKIEETRLLGMNLIAKILIRNTEIVTFSPKLLETCLWHNEIF